MPGAYKQPVSVLVVIHTADGQVLLLERAKQPGMWQSVTGSLEPGETQVQAAVREVQEETGIRADPAVLADWRLTNRFEIYPRWRDRYAPGVTHNTEHVFSLCVPGVIPAEIAPDEHRAWEWLPRELAAARCFSWTNRDAILLLDCCPA